MTCATIALAEGLVRFLSLSYYYPNWEFRYQLSVHAKGAKELADMEDAVSLRDLLIESGEKERS